MRIVLCGLLTLTYLNDSCLEKANNKKSDYSLFFGNEDYLLRILNKNVLQIQLRLVFKRISLLKISITCYTEN